MLKGVMSLMNKEAQIKMPSPSAFDSQESWDPFNLAEDVISNHIIKSQDPKETYDVDSLYNVVSNIVKSSTHVDRSLDLKRPKTVELIEDKVSQSSSMPSFSILKEIACEMTCKPFSLSSAHQGVLEILKELEGYKWDATAVIALTAFALDYGETWRLSLMKATKENALEIHIFRFGEESKPSQDKADLIPTLVDHTLDLIKDIITLENMNVNATYSPKDLPAFYAAPRGLYTYWAIMALLACANRKKELDWEFKSNVVGKLKHYLLRLNDDLTKIRHQKALLEDYNWRLGVFHSHCPGIFILLKALIFSRDTEQLEFFDNAYLNRVVIKDKLEKNFLLFISGLDNIEKEIHYLISIHKEFAKDEKKKNYQILWVPVVETCGKEERKKFDNLKAKMPWYVLPNLFVIYGKRLLEEEWHYQGKPMVVVTDFEGTLVNQNAIQLISDWGIKGFPFTHEMEIILSQNWNWFWTEAYKLCPEIEKWTGKDSTDTYIFIYGGTDGAVTQGFRTQLDGIRSEDLFKNNPEAIKDFNLQKVDDLTKIRSFWENVTNSFLSIYRKKNSYLSKLLYEDGHGQESMLEEIQTFLSYNNEKGWALLSKGKSVQVLGYGPLMTKVLKDFKEWKSKMNGVQDFHGAFIDYYNLKMPEVPLPHCRHFQLLGNRNTEILRSISCTCCKQKMEIEIVSYKCCHGTLKHRASENGKSETQVSNGRAL